MPSVLPTRACVHSMLAKRAANQDLCAQNAASQRGDAQCSLEKVLSHRVQSCWALVPCTSPAQCSLRGPARTPACMTSASTHARKGACTHTRTQAHTHTRTCLQGRYAAKKPSAKEPCTPMGGRRRTKRAAQSHGCAVMCPCARAVGVLLHRLRVSRAATALLCALPVQLAGCLCDGVPVPVVNPQGYARAN